MNYTLTACIVLYRNDWDILERAIKSFLSTTINIKLFLVDNSPTDELKDITDDRRVEYIHNPSNPGFGGGHNIAIERVINKSKYHLILNPDIFFNGGVLEDIIKYLDTNSNIGVLMPKVLYPNGNVQYLAKLLPTPLDFILRRTIPISSIREKVGHRFELRKSQYEKIMDVPFLSGCFLMFRTDVLKKIGGFDAKIFMYTEDIDICRRVIQEGYRSVFYPKVHVFHDHEKKSFSDISTFKIYLKSGLYYFNKWGWLSDFERRKINKHTLEQIKK